MAETRRESTNPEDFRKITEIFEAARQLEPQERVGYLDEACRDNSSLRAEVEALLAMHAAADTDQSFLDAGRALRDAMVETKIDSSLGRETENIGRYEIVEKIAQGGVGAVLKGKDDVLGREIAIKVLLDAHKRNPELVERLTEEAQIGGQLQHPGIVPVYEFGLVGGDRPYITMKLVEGRTLADLLAERAHPAEERQHFLGIFEQVCQAMAYAHSRGVIHRDLKPLNLMVGAFGEVQVMDWGLAKVISRERRVERDRLVQSVHTLRTDATDSASLAGVVMGTPMYMSPEQARGEVESLDPRTDVFSLGAILCEILTGKPPYSARTIGEVVAQASEGDIGEALERLRASNADREVISLAERCLAFERDDRPSDARTLADELNRYLESLEERAHEAALDAAAARARAKSERKARILTTVVGVVITLSVALGGAGYVWYEQERQARVHRSEVLAGGAIQETEQLLSEARSAGPTDVTRWEAALVAARGARDLSNDEVSESLRTRAAELASRIETRLRAARLIERLTAIRAEYDYVDRLDENPDHDRRYAEAFRDHLGVDLESLSPEAAAERLAAGGFSEELGQALDEWTRVKRLSDDVDSAGWKRLLRIANLVDPHPVRTTLRTAFEADDREALQELADSPALEESSPLTVFLLSRLLSAARDSARSRVVLRKGQARHPTDFWINYNLARSLSLEDPVALDESVEYFMAALALRPDYPMVYHSLGNAYSRLGRTDRGTEVIRRGLRIAPDSAALHLSLGNALAASGDLDGAEVAHRRALELLPEDRRLAGLVYMNLGHTLFSRNRVDEAVPLFEKSLELHPNIALSHFYLGQVHIRRGELDRAIERLRTALQVGPDNWRAFEMHAALGSALFRAGEVDAAIDAYTESVRLKPDYQFAHAALGTALARRGEFGRAVSSLSEAIRLQPEDEPPYRQLLDLLNRSGARLSDGGGAGGIPADTLADLLSLLDEVVNGRRPYHPEARHLYVRVWCAAPEMLYNARVLRAAEVSAESSGRGDPHLLWHLGDVQMLVGKTREAVRTLEEAAHLQGATGAVLASLRKCREALLPDLATYASIDAALSELPSGTSPAEIRRQLGEFLALDRTADHARRVAFLEGRLLQHERRHEEAAEKFREILEVDRRDPEPYAGLWQSLRASRSPEDARALFRAALKQGALPKRPLPYPPETPRALEPLSEEIIGSLSAALESSAFEHIDPRVRHYASHWQARREDADYRRNPVLDLFTAEHLDRLALPPGLLVSGEDIFWRVRYLGTDGRFSRFSAERSFRVGDPVLEAVPFDLTAHFTHDVIANPLDLQDDAFDQVGYRLIVELPEGNRNDVQGLPIDGAIGVHRLGPYDDRNGLRLEVGATSDVRIDVPPARYVALRFLVAGANGDSSVPVTLDFSDGTSEDHTLPCYDWFDDALEGRPAPAGIAWTAVWNGMDRAGTRGFEDRNDAALFEVVVPVRGSGEVRTFVLRSARATYESPDTRFYLFAATGVREKATE